ncbi:hypothetical protein OROHE_017217 [Orobanche hederae]
MASSQTFSQSLKKKESIINGRGFNRFVVTEKIKTESEDLDIMELVVTRIKQQGLYCLGNAYPELYDERAVEEFYLDASVCFHSLKKGGDVADITVVVRGVEFCINRHLLKDIFGMPSNGLKMEDLETFGSQELLTAYWGLFTGKSSNIDLNPSCLKKRFCLPFVYLHDFCCRVIEN